MKYSNGFDVDVVLPALKQRLGWMQPSLAGSPVLAGDSLVSKSGRYYNDGSFHALCTIENLQSVQENPEVDNTGFNTLLDTMQTGQIMRLLNQVFRQPELIEQCLMYTRFGMNDMPISNSGQWAGWVINVANDSSISTQITMGTFYFDKDVTFNMYLFQDGVRTPLKTIPINVVAYQRTEVDFDSLVLNFKTGRRYYFAYNQADLGTARAIREQIDTVATTRCFEAYTFTANPTTDGTFFDHNQRQYPFLPAGVNLEIISFKDHTQKILRKVNLFDEAQGVQMAAVVLEMINNSNRTNKTQRQSGENTNQLYMDINQAYASSEVPVTPGLKSRVNGEIKRLTDTFFPPQTAYSTSMIADGDYIDSYEQNWAKQNYIALTNPPAYVGN